MRWGSLNTLQTLTLIWLGAGPGSQARCVEPLYGDIQLEDSITRVLSPGVTNTLDLFPPKHQILGWQQHVPLTVTCHINQTPLLSITIGWFLSACLLLRVPVWLSAAVMRWAVGPRFRDQDPVTGTSHHQSWKWRFPEISQPRRRAFSLLKVPNNLLAISTFTKNLWRHYMLTKVQLSVLIDSIVKALVAFNKQKALLGPSLGTVKASRRFVSSSTSEHPTCGYSRLPSAAMSSCSGCCPSGILDYTQPWPHIGGLISHQHLQQPSRTGARGISCS